LLFIAVLSLIFILFACTTSSATAIDSPFSSAAIGDTIHLGGHDWRVLDIQGDRALVVSEYILMQRQWNFEQRLIHWDTSSLRYYLNSSFFDNAFSDEEKQFILETQIRNYVNPWYGTAGGGADTMDRVFLLSLHEVVYYFGDSGTLSGLTGTPVPNLPGFILDEYNDSRRTTAIDEDVVPWWWTRTPGRSVNSLQDASAAAVTGAGDIFVYGIYLVTEGGVRPALWLQL